VAPTHFEPPPGDALQPRVVPRHAGVRRLRCIPAPPQLPEDDAAACPAPPAREATPHAAPPPVTLAAAALCRELLDLRDTGCAHAVAPNTGFLWARPRRAARCASRPDALSPPLPHDPECGPCATPGPASGQHDTELHSVLSWREMLGGNGDGVAPRDPSLPAHAARRARIYAELSLWERAGMAATQSHRAALWLSALPTPGVGGGAIPGAAMRAALRL